MAPNNPVYLLRADNHMGWFNSMALEMAGITKDTPEPQGGQILKTDKQGLLFIFRDTNSLVLYTDRNCILIFTNKHRYHLAIRRILKCIGKQVEYNLFPAYRRPPKDKDAPFPSETGNQSDVPRLRLRNYP